MKRIIILSFIMALLYSTPDREGTIYFPEHLKCRNTRSHTINPGSSFLGTEVARKKYIVKIIYLCGRTHQHPPPPKPLSETRNTTRKETGSNYEKMAKKGLMRWNMLLPATLVLDKAYSALYGNSTTLNNVLKAPKTRTDRRAFKAVILE
jgi:hypothetical protein